MNSLWTDGIYLAFDFRVPEQIVGILNMFSGDYQLLCDLNACNLFGYSSKRLIWLDHSSSWYAASPNRSWDIYVYDISSHSKRNLTADLYAQDRPSIDGRYAAWHDCRYDDNFSEAPDQCDVFEIVLYDFDKNQIRRVTNRPEIYDQSPWVSGNRLVWTRYDPRKGTNTAMLYEIDTQKTYELFDNGCVYRPYLQLSGDKMFYIEQRCRTDQDSLYMYDLACHFDRRAAGEVGQ